MAIFYWLNQGRLGNLLFQCAAILRHTDPGDRVYSFHNDVFDLLDMDPRFRVVAGNGRLSRSASYRVNKAVRFAEQHGLVGSLKAEPQVLFEKYVSESRQVMKSAGALRNCFLVDGFFQDGHLRDVPLRIKPRLVRAAGQHLAAATRAGTRVSVHLRLTDYGHWAVFGVPGTVISADWYRDRMDQFRRRVDSPQFVVFSDDPGAAKDLLAGDDVVYFQGESAIEDFSVMSVCDHAIMSPSTFSWWSAFVLPHPGKILMAPKYWAGFKSNCWYPSSMVTEGVEYYPVQ